MYFKITECFSYGREIERTLIVEPYSGALVYYFDLHAPILVSAYFSHISYNIDSKSVFGGHVFDGVSFNGFFDVHVGINSPVLIPRTRSSNNLNRSFPCFQSALVHFIYTLSAYF